jgi:epoxyqueuosine reductase
LRGRIAAYAGIDYHEFIKPNYRISSALSNLCQTCGLTIHHWTLLEREWAYRSGLGWFGKNTMLLHKQAGSWLLLAEIRESRS